MDIYPKVNETPILIECVEDEHEESRDFQPSFWWNNKRYFLDDFTRCHNNPWIFDNFSEHIHAMESNNYYDPLFIELINDDYINIYVSRSPQYFYDKGYRSWDKEQLLKEKEELGLKEEDIENLCDQLKLIENENY